MTALTPKLLNVTEGTTTQWDFHLLDSLQPPQAQAQELKEDMAQVVLAPNALLDIGWYPSFAVDGQFRVVIVLDGDWDAPVFIATASDWQALRDAVTHALAAAKEALTS